MAVVIALNLLFIAEYGHPLGSNLRVQPNGFRLDLTIFPERLDGIDAI
jgi:hypothetical protein